MSKKTAKEKAVKAIEKAVRKAVHKGVTETVVGRAVKSSIAKGTERKKVTRGDGAKKKSQTISPSTT